MLFIRFKCTEKAHFSFRRIYEGNSTHEKRIKNFALLNYDASSHEMLFKQNGTELILVNEDQIDTVYIGNRTFVPTGNRFSEVISLENGVVFIDWLLKNAYRGYKGAYGQISQAKVEVINTAELTNDLYENQSAEV